MKIMRQLLSVSSKEIESSTTCFQLANAANSDCDCDCDCAMTVIEKFSKGGCTAAMVAGHLQPLVAPATTVIFSLASRSSLSMMPSFVLLTSPAMSRFGSNLHPVHHSFEGSLLPLLKPCSLRMANGTASWATDHASIRTTAGGL